MGMGGKPLKLERRMKLCTVKVVEHRTTLHKDVVECLSMEIFNPQLDMSLSVLLYLSPLWADSSPEVPLTLQLQLTSVILYEIMVA